MGTRMNNLKNVFSDTRIRIIFIVMVVFTFFGIILGYFLIHKNAKGPEANVALTNVPQVEPTPGSKNPTQEYAKLLEEQNAQQAQQALKTGGSAVPTIIQESEIAPGKLNIIPAQSINALQAALNELIRTGCDPKSLANAVKAGAKLNDLKAAGCTAQQLMAAGFSVKALEQAGFSACDLLSSNGIDPKKLKEAGFSAGELRGVGFNACQLKKAGFNAEDLQAAGFLPDELKGVGFSAQDIAGAASAARILAPQAGASLYPGLPAGVSASALKAAGCGRMAMLKAKSLGVSAMAVRQIVGCSAKELKEGGYLALELKAAGYSAGELKDAGFSAIDLKNAGFTAEELRYAGFTALALKNAGFSAKDLKIAGFTAGELKKAGFTINELKQAGFSAEDLLAAGFSPSELAKAGFSAEDIANAADDLKKTLSPAAYEILEKGDCSVKSTHFAHEEGVNAFVMHEIGCSPAELKAGGYTAKELKAAGYTPGELKNAGFTAKELLDAGFTIQELRQAGFTLRDLKNAGLTAEELKNAGYTAGELSRAGFSLADLIKAGFTPAELRAAGFTAEQLRQNGITDQQLKDAGFDIGELRQAGLNANDLKNLGYSASDLKKAGYNDRQLSSAGFTPEVTKKPEDSATPTQTGPKIEIPAIDKANQETAQAQQLKQAEQRQDLQLRSEQLQALREKVASSMTTQASQLFTAWKPAQQSYQEGTLANSDSGSGSAQAGQNAGKVSGPPLFKAGTILFATIDTGINSDEPGPVLATIVSGKYKGARLIGKLTTFGNFGQKVMVTFYTMTLPNYPSSININAVAVDADTARTGLSSYTNNHYLLKYGALFASSFLEGYGQAFLQSGQSVAYVGGLVPITIARQLSGTDKLFVALGNVGNSFGQQIATLANLPPTVHVYSGTGVGILFTQDVSQPN